jgi:hypothetical protein
MASVSILNKSNVMLTVEGVDGNHYYITPRTVQDLPCEPKEDSLTSDLKIIIKENE